MIPQLIARLAPMSGANDAVTKVITADPLDLVLHMEQVWDIALPWGGEPNPRPAGRARKILYDFGEFHLNVPVANPAWDHLIYSYVLENTRIVQILRRVVREYRSGEGLGIASVATQRWLDITETLLFGAPNPIPLWLSTSSIRTDPEAIRRNVYWRMFGLDLAFGLDDNRPPTYDKAMAANTTFVTLFEELLFELWQAISNLRNSSGPNASDDDRIYRLTEQLGYLLRSRRQDGLLSREELVAATALGWCELAVLTDTPLVVDLRADATSPGDRLRLIGERVGLAPHSKSAALFSMAADISILLRAIEARWVSGPDRAWLLYRTDIPTGITLDPKDGKPFGVESRRVITEWAAATGRDLKARAKPMVVDARLASTNGRSLVGVR